MISEIEERVWYLPNQAAKLQLYAEEYAAMLRGDSTMVITSNMYIACAQDGVSVRRLDKIEGIVKTEHRRQNVT